MISSLCCRGMPWPLNVLGLWRPGWMRPLAACWAHSTPSCARLPRVPRPWLSSAHFVIDPLKKDISTDWMETINTMGSMGSMGSMVFLRCFFGVNSNGDPQFAWWNAVIKRIRAVVLKAKSIVHRNYAFLMPWCAGSESFLFTAAYKGFEASFYLPTPCSRPISMKIHLIVGFQAFWRHQKSESMQSTGSENTIVVCQWPYGFWLKDGSQLFTAPLSY